MFYSDEEKAGLGDWFSECEIFCEHNNIEFKLMQFTGLHDKTKWEELSKKEQEDWVAGGETRETWKGREIWEGDIIQYSCKTIPDKISFEVIFNNGEFCQTRKTDNRYYPDIWYDWEEVEVIGNPYENSELLSQ
jgi:hypothetical protein